MCTKVIEAFEPLQAGVAGRRGKIVAAGTGVLSLLTVLIHLASTLPPDRLLEMAILLLGALAVGWAGRSAVHVGLRYFWPLPRGEEHRYRLMLVSLLNICFTILWMATVVALWRDPNPYTALTVVTAVSGLAFLLSMWTLAAARDAGYQRGSEWVRGHFRNALEPGRNTWLGWLLVKLIDLRSKESNLSTFVSGTLALLLVVAAMIAPAAMSGASTPQQPRPDARHLHDRPLEEPGPVQPKHFS